MNTLPSVNGSGRHSLAANLSVVQSASGAAFAPASIVVAFPVAPPVGDVLIVAFWNNAQSSCAANTYAAPSGWTLADQELNQWCTTYQSFSHVVGAGETNNYVFTPAAAQRSHSWIAEDVGNAGGIDTATHAYIASGTTWTTPSVTPSQSTDLALALQLPYTGSALTWTNPVGWTLATGPTSQWRGESLYQQLASTATVSETSTLSASAYGYSAIILLTASGTQPTPPPPTPPPPTPAPGSAPTVSQWTSGASYAPTSITVSFPNAPAPGHLLLATFWNNGQANCAANTYTPPSGWSLVSQDLVEWCTTYQSFSHVVTAGETNGYVFMTAAAQRSHSWIGADAASTSGIDKANSSYIGSGATFTTPTVTPSQSSDLAIALQLPYTGSTLTWTNPAGWTLGTGPTAQWRGESVYQPLGSTAAVSETSTLSAPAYGYSSMVLLSPSNAPVPTPSPAPAYTDWNSFGYNLSRTGYNPNEATLSAPNVASSSLKQVWATDLGGAVTAQPVLATGVTINGTPTNVLYIGAENNIFYAINADTGAILWKNTTLGTALATGCGDLPGGQFGITGTAAYDKNSGVVYVADATDNVHALNVSTGAEQWSVNVLFDPNTNTTVGSTTQDHIYGALTLNTNNGMLYASTGSFCDKYPWHGRIVAINTSTHSVVAAFFPGRTAAGKSGTAYCGGGIWGMGGASIDTTTNDVFVATGNMFTTLSSTCPADSLGETYPYGDAVVQLDSQLNLISYDAANVNGTKATNDSDYGATPMLYTVPNCSAEQLSAKNKNGYLYTYAVNAAGITAEQQLHVGNTSNNGIFIGVPAFDPANGLVYVGNPNANGNYAHGLNALQQNTGCTGLNLAWKASIGSANVTSDDNQAPTVANGVVYFTDGVDDKLWAFDATSGAQLWNSGTTIGSPCASYGTACGVFGAATVDGRVFVGSWNHKLYAFGL